MSTGYYDIKLAQKRNLSRFADLAKLGEVVFHVDDLANLWQNKTGIHSTRP